MVDWLDVSDEDPRIYYTVGATPQTVFVVPFLFFANGDLTVTVDDVAQTLTTDYTVTGAGDEDGGTVTFGTAVSNCTVSIRRNTAIELQTHIPTFGPLDVGGLNLQNSRFTAIMQELRSRAALLSESSRYSNLSLPDPETGKYLKWKTDLSGLENDSAVTHAPNDYAVATQSEAEAGTLNDVLMTPLRTAQLLRSSTVVNAREFGVLGDDATDNQSDLTSAITYCKTNGVTLGFGDGIYRHSGTNVWGYEKLRVHALGDNVWLKHTGSGVANDFNATALYPASQGAAGGVFGGPNRFIIDGNANTTDTVLVDNWHFGHMKIAPRNATNSLLLLQNTGIVGASAVESTFEVEITTNIPGAFTTIPLYGISATDMVACVFNKMIVESVGNVASGTAGASFVNCIGNVFNAGTVESCLAGGIALNAGSHRNVFIGVHCEVNGSQQDWTIAGDNNTFIACIGAASTQGQYLSGSYNDFLNCTFQSMNIQPGAIENDFRKCTILTAFTDTGTRTSTDSIAGISPRRALRGPMTVSAEVAVPAGGTAGTGLMFSSADKLGIIFGSGAPTAQAAQGSLYIRTDGVGVSSRLYVNTTGSTAWTAVTTVG